MIHYDNLPIFKSALDLVVYAEAIVKGFVPKGHFFLRSGRKYHKYTVGEDLHQYTKEVLSLIQRANMSEQKPGLITLRNKCEEVKMLIHVTHELKVFSGFKMGLSEIKHFLSVKASFAGHIKHANSYNLLNKVGQLDETNPFDYTRA